eukprot:g27557.t1
MQVERRVSTATAPIHVERRVSSASTSLASVERQVSTASAPVQESASGCKATLLSHGRSLSSSGRFSSTLAWSPRSVTSSFHLSPRVQTYLKPCSSSLQRPPVVRIDLTALAPQAVVLPQIGMHHRGLELRGELVASRICNLSHAYVAQRSPLRCLGGHSSLFRPERPKFNLRPSQRKRIRTRRRTVMM